MTRIRIVSASIAAAGLFGAGLVAGQALADQPHMQRALDALQAARSELSAAQANKGGHRVKAMQLVDGAIAETRAGMSYAGN